MSELLKDLFGEEYIFKSELDEIILETKILALLEEKNPRYAKFIYHKYGLGSGEIKSYREMQDYIFNEDFRHTEKLGKKLCVERIRYIHRISLRKMRQYVVSNKIYYLVKGKYSETMKSYFIGGKENFFSQHLKQGDIK